MAAGDRGSQVNIESNNICPQMIMLPAVCQGSSNLAEQMEVFMACRHPLDLLGMFHEDEVDSGSGEKINVNACMDEGDSLVKRVSGYYTIPRSCEYCGSHSIDLCHENAKCERPRSFFPRERPPFCSKREFEIKNGRGLQPKILTD